MIAKVLNVCTSPRTGTQKQPVERVNIVAGFGLMGDAHGGGGHRQVSLLADESAARIRGQGVAVGPGDFGENILTRGIELAALPVGAILRIGDVELEISQIGKECHTRCAIFHAAGTCAMPTDGVFCTVRKGGSVSPGVKIEVRGLHGGGKFYEINVGVPGQPEPQLVK